jgi:hypothetical protein
MVLGDTRSASVGRSLVVMPSASAPPFLRSAGEWLVFRRETGARDFTASTFELARIAWACAIAGL